MLATLLAAVALSAPLAEGWESPQIAEEDIPVGGSFELASELGGSFELAPEPVTVQVEVAVAPSAPVALVVPEPPQVLPAEASPAPTVEVAPLAIPAPAPPPQVAQVVVSEAPVAEPPPEGSEATIAHVEATLERARKGKHPPHLELSVTGSTLMHEPINFADCDVGWRISRHWMVALTGGVGTPQTLSQGAQVSARAGIRPGFFIGDRVRLRADVYMGYASSVDVYDGETWQLYGMIMPRVMAQARIGRYLRVGASAAWRHVPGPAELVAPVEGTEIGLVVTLGG